MVLVDMHTDWSWIASDASARVSRLLSGALVGRFLPDLAASRRGRGHFEDGQHILFARRESAMGKGS